jgi:aralkylamine N-acetyltransferase
MSAESTEKFSFLVDPTPEELRQIVDLYRSAGWWKVEEDYLLAAGIVAGSHCFLVVRRENRIVGMGRAFSDRASDAYIQDVTVEKELRRQGLGSRIIQELVIRLEADGLKWIGLIAESGSQKFYENLGFAAMTGATPMLRISESRS